MRQRRDSHTQGAVGREVDDRDHDQHDSDADVGPRVAETGGDLATHPAIHALACTGRAGGGGQPQHEEEADGKARRVPSESPPSAEGCDRRSGDDGAQHHRSLRGHVDHRVAWLELVIRDDARKDRLAGGHEEGVEDAEGDGDRVDLPHLHATGQHEHRKGRYAGRAQAHRREHRRPW